MVITSLFMLGCGALGFVNILDVKEQKEAEKADTLASIKTLEEGYATLEENADVKAKIDAGMDPCLAANVYGIMNHYHSFPLQMAGMLSVGVSALIFTVSIIGFKNALTELPSGK